MIDVIRRLPKDLKKDTATQKYLYLQSTADMEFSRRKKVPRTGGEGEKRN